MASTRPSRQQAWLGSQKRSWRTGEPHDHSGVLGRHARANSERIAVAGYGGFGRTPDQGTSCSDRLACDGRSPSGRVAGAGVTRMGRDASRLGRAAKAAR